ncbi:NAD(P)H-hydrate dehydratase [Pseudoalteromonas mariniglutinosa]|uniref:NAD(P)H-hydrate dehydratase n=1 Tax=Pseudoalteromonas mariniglutinosa TaxID=206042 RepID=UPI0038505CC2
MQHHDLAQQLFLAQQVREYESKAAARAGVSMFTLMKRAGQAVFIQCVAHFPNVQRYVILVGHGNNAGDAYIVASLAKQAGKEVAVLAADLNKQLSGDALTAQRQWQALGGSIENYTANALNNAEIIIDGLLGTGLNNTVREPFLTMIKEINAQPLPIIAIDLPSGLNADTGMVQGAAIKATITVTFVGIKQGLTTGLGRTYVGQLIFDDLAIADEFSALTTATASRVNINSFQRMAKRPEHSHKGSHGKLLCIGGNQGTAGAIRLSGEAALRMGAGAVRVYTHHTSVMPISIGRPELMVSAEDLDSALRWASCVVIGPGLGQDDWAQHTFDKVMLFCLAKAIPLVMDADALNLLANSVNHYHLRHTVMTPHPGEAARLLSVSCHAIEANRFYYAKQLATRYAATCVLKGAGTIIDSDAHTWVCEEGSPALAVAGSGDVLTGVIGGLLAQGLDTELAARYGVTLHAKAGSIAAEQSGERGMLASDLFMIIRQLVNCS